MVVVGNVVMVVVVNVVVMYVMVVVVIVVVMYVVVVVIVVVMYVVVVVVNVQMVSQQSCRSDKPLNCQVTSPVGASSAVSLRGFSCKSVCCILDMKNRQTRDKWPLSASSDSPG